MKIEIEYTREDVNQIILAEHVKSFGPLPAGEEWVVTGSYGERKVTNRSIKEDEPDEIPDDDADPLA